jgi:penicillin-binding protein 2
MAPSDTHFTRIFSGGAAFALAVSLIAVPWTGAQEISTGAVKTSPVETPETPRPEPEAPAKKRDPLSSIEKLQRIPSEPAPADPDEKTGPEKEAKPAPDPEPDPKKDSIGSSFVTQIDARTFTLSVPAPRGQILDRNGFPLAQNRVVYYAAVNFPLLEGADDTAILRYAGERIVHANKLLSKRWDLTAEVVLGHYKNRRWLPLTFSDPLTEEETNKLRQNSMRGLMLHPVYLRHYPQGRMLSHVLGYVGKRPPRKLGPIEANEPLWGEALGVAGLEETFDKYLTGEPGRVNMLYEADGTKLREEIVRRPRPGNNIITSIDAEMQRLAEDLLAKNVKRGAFVIMDVRTGDVLAMASYPQFNPNDFIPSISQEDYTKLQNDPEMPLFPRSFRGSYPPASTFKVPVAIAALEEKTIGPNSYYECPPTWYVGDIVMRNWNKEAEGAMNVVGALARSCNTWFYQVGTETGADPVTMMARRLGLGEKTGIPIRAEVDGLVPTNRWWRQKYGYNMSTGDLANICIGQGQVEASPLQVARMMAAVGNGHAVVKPRLVKQIQDYNNGVIQTLPVEEVSQLNIDPQVLNLVRRGMSEVVNSGRGTGRSAGNPKIDVAGKTGTGQWKPALHQNIAWFGGFAPADYPVLSFAVISEGDPGEVLSGGKSAAPLVGQFLEAWLGDEAHLAEIKDASNEVKLALASLEPEGRDSIGSGGGNGGGGIFKDSGTADQYGDQAPAETGPAPPPAMAEQESGLSRFFRKLRGRP